MFSIPNLEPTYCSMSDSNCCFLTCIQVFQETGKVVWYFHLFQNFWQLVVIHRVRSFNIVNKAKVDVSFWNSLAFSMIQHMLTIWSLIPLPFLNPAWTSIWKFSVHVLLKPSLKDFEHNLVNMLGRFPGEGKGYPLQYSGLENSMDCIVHEVTKSGTWLSNFHFVSMWNECKCMVVWTFFGIALLWDWNENWLSPVLWPLLSFQNLLTYWVQHFGNIISLFI